MQDETFCKFDYLFGNYYYRRVQLALRARVPYLTLPCLSLPCLYLAFAAACGPFVLIACCLSACLLVCFFGVKGETGALAFAWQSIFLVLEYGVRRGEVSEVSCGGRVDQCVACGWW